MSAGIFAIIAAGMFTGAAVYISLVEHAARLASGPPGAVAEFGASYRRGAPFMGSLLIAGIAAAAIAWMSSGNVAWFIGALVFAAPIPFTLVLIRPINTRLLDPAINPEFARALLIRWGRLHVVRCGFGLTAFLIFLSAALRTGGR